MIARIHLVTGKGGTGRTTHALSLALALAARGHRTWLVELGEEPGASVERLPAGLMRRPLGGEMALAAFLRAHLPSRRLASIAAGNATLATLFRAAPGTVEVAQLDALERWRSSGEVDRIVIDGEATGHTLLWLELPQVFATLGAGGVLGPRLSRIEAMLRDERFVVHAASSPRVLVTRETVALSARLAELGVRRGALLVTAEPEDGVSAAAARAAQEALAGSVAEEDLSHERSARAQAAAARTMDPCGFERVIVVPHVARDDRFLERLAVRGEDALGTMEAP